MMRLIAFSSCLFLVGVVWGEEKKVEERPNVIFILADDLGWGDLSCYGNRHLKTKNLDALAASGTLYTQFYVSGSVCSPSRCAFFTGQYPARQKIHGHYATPELNQSRAMTQFLDPNVTNVARLLKGAGYKTAHVGKWHLGSNSGGPEPTAYGFDFVGTTEKGTPEHKGDIHFRAKSTRIFVDEALEFMAKNRDEKFYLQLWTFLPHATLVPTEEQMKPFAGQTNPNIPFKSPMTIYNASVNDLDEQVGRLIAGLESLKLRKKTLVIFSSDNGPEDIHVINAAHSGVGSAGPFRGRKRSLYEGGVRVPFLVSWPGHVPKGVVNDKAVVAGVDFLPTVCQLAGVTLSDGMTRDGESMADVFLGGDRARKGELFWEWRFKIAGEVYHHSPQLAVRSGDWKLYLNPDRSRVELYDMPHDPTQLDNVADKNPEVVARLSKLALEWQQTLPEGPRDQLMGAKDYPWPKSTAKTKDAGK